MSRILLVTLAVLSLLLAFVFSMSLLYALAILLFGLAVVHYLYQKRNEFFPAGSKSSSSLPVAADDDLRSLGIMEIKPREKKSTASDSTPTDEPQETAHEPVAAAQSTPSGSSKSVSATRPPKSHDLFAGADDATADFAPGQDVSSARPVKPKKRDSSGKKNRKGDVRTSGRSSSSNEIKAKPRAGENYIAVQEAEDEQLAQVLVPCLVSLRAAVNAHTVCVLSYKLDTTKYSIVGIVSKNGYARTSGSFISPVPLVSSTKSRNTVEVTSIGPDGLLEDAIGYYRENIAVRSVATARIYATAESKRFLLLADSFDESFVSDETACRMFDRYAQVIGPMLDMHYGTTTDDSTGSRPRREIIADEISNARAASKDLALALVYLNDAEDASEKSRSEIDYLEEQLDKLLRRSTDKGRVEHFGELTFGVLYRGNVNDVERWAIRIQNEATRSGNGLSVGVSVGVAMLTERHQGPDELRSDASTALEEALETGACTILE
ncbi:MAG: hypothetical protein HKN43_13085 [Rhodothermales bacterium]|nr:hypothetical protein [Rhodothermales bacterium]